MKSVSAISVPRISSYNLNNEMYKSLDKRAFEYIKSQILEDEGYAVISNKELWNYLYPTKKYYSMGCVNIIKRLVAKGLIQVKYSMWGDRIDKRLIYLGNKASEYEFILSEDTLYVDMNTSQKDILIRTPNRKAIYRMIVEDCKENGGYSELSNRYFETMLNLGEDTVKKVIKALKQGNLIRTELNEKGNKRKIYLTNLKVKL